MDKYQIFKSYVFNLLFCSMVFYYQISGCCCNWIPMRLSLSILWSCIKPLTQSNLEANTNKGEYYHWIGDNEKYQTIHLIFLGLIEIIQVDKHEVKIQSLWRNTESKFSEEWGFFYGHYKWGLVVKDACYNPSHALWSILF